MTILMKDEKYSVNNEELSKIYSVVVAKAGLLKNEANVEEYNEESNESF